MHQLKIMQGFFNDNLRAQSDGSNDLSFMYAALIPAVG